MIVREIQRPSGLSASKDTNRKGSSVHCKMKTKPAPHNSQRMQWARNHMSYGQKWQPVIFSDEKSGIWMVQMAGHLTNMTCARNIVVFSVADKVVDR
ncbi:hypothetical protein AVEN_9961-1 [Araneus ventricosus]|uniref:Transposase Tc1-like domain-containing protein n=1 Tax=Araneus ventricosus TaxID=182803 RepID=A0A4Y2F885_ARAVE|nr:hypothetical protein AVEN_9961-1 [Araneus ventricosus]